MKQLSIALLLFFLAQGTSAQTHAKEIKDVKKMHTHCYAMKDNAMIHCMGDKGEPMTSNVKLPNGTGVSTSGAITFSNGQKNQLGNGQCIDRKGKIRSFEEAHHPSKKGKM